LEPAAAVTNVSFTGTSVIVHMAPKLPAHVKLYQRLTHPKLFKICWTLYMLLLSADDGHL
jgi:hypothetical protein